MQVIREKRALNSMAGANSGQQVATAIPANAHTGISTTARGLAPYITTLVPMVPPAIDATISAGKYGDLALRVMASQTPNHCKYATDPKYLLPYKTTYSS